MKFILLSLSIMLISCVSPETDLSTRLKEFKFIDEKIAINLSKVYECKAGSTEYTTYLSGKNISSIDYVVTDTNKVLGIKYSDHQKIVTYKNLPNSKKIYDEYLVSRLEKTSIKDNLEIFSLNSLSGMLALMKDTNDVENYVLGRIYERGKYFAPNGGSIYLRRDGVMFKTGDNAAYYSNDLRYAIEYYDLNPNPCADNLLPPGYDDVYDFAAGDYEYDVKEIIEEFLNENNLDINIHKL